MRLPAVVCVLIATMGGCASMPAPAAADALPPGVEGRRVFAGEQLGGAGRVSAVDPLGYRPATVPAASAGLPGPIYDTPIGWLPAGQRGGGPWAGRTSGYTIAALPAGAWNGSSEDWNPPGLDLPPGGGGVEPPHHDPTDKPDVPGPVGLAGVAAAYGWARRLRRRVG